MPLVPDFLTMPIFWQGSGDKRDIEEKGDGDDHGQRWQGEEKEDGKEEEGDKVANDADADEDDKCLKDNAEDCVRHRLDNGGGEEQRAKKLHRPFETEPPGGGKGNGGTGEFKKKSGRWYCTPFKDN